MKRIETNTKTFSKATRKMIVKLLPNARTFGKQHMGMIRIADANNKQIAVWHAVVFEAGKPTSKNAMLHIM